MLTLATAWYLKVLLNSGAQGEVPAIGLWFVAILLDFTLLVGALVLFGG